MQIKKILITGAASILGVSLLVSPVSAHHGQRGGHHGQRHGTTAPAASTTCGVCHLDGCTSTERHVHNGVTYCGYSHENDFCDGTCQIAP